MIGTVFEVAIIGSIAAAGYFIYKYIKDITDWLDNLFKNIIDIPNKIKEKTEEYFFNIKNDAGNFFDRSRNGFVGGFKSIF